jgi:hypothetical protein
MAHAATRVPSPVAVLLFAGSIATACAPCSNLAAHTDLALGASTPIPPADAPPVPPQRYPPPIAPPRNVACAFKSNAWPRENTEEGLGYHYLRFGPGAAPVAQIYAGSDVELLLPAALASAGGYLRIYASGVWLEGHLEASEMPLYAASPLVLSGVFIPDSFRRLVWRSARPGKITVSSDAGPRVRASGNGLGAELDCARISIGPGTIESSAMDALMKAPPGSENLVKPWLKLRPGRVELSTTAGGESVVEIDVVEPPDDSVLVRPLRLLGRERNWSRVGLRPYGGVLFGWVRNDALQRSTKDYMDLSHDVDNILLKKGREGAAFFACETDLPLFAEAGGEQRLVGRVRAGTAFERLGTKAEWTIVDFPRSPLAPAKDALLLLETSRQAGCGPAPAPKATPPPKPQ